jgi:phosphoribosylglycinamide formyltransferase-1
MKRIVALASGNGTNFTAVLKGLKQGQIQDAAVVALVTDRPHTGAAVAAVEAGIPVVELDYTGFASRAAFDSELLAHVRTLTADLVLALGFMRILSPDFVAAFPNRIINVHPSLLPAFPGMNAQKQAIEYGARVTGVTVHFMDAGVDSGPIILQEAVSIPVACSTDELRAILRPIEHKLVVEAVSLFCEERISVDGRHVISKPIEEVPT